MSLRICNLTKNFGKQEVLKGISFEIKPGEILGFLGPNGAGKSTTMKIATGCLAPDYGSVYINEVSMAEDPVYCKSRIGYLPENNPLYYDLYVREYLEFAGRLHGLKGSKLSERIEFMLDEVGMAHEKGKKIGSLSKGYKQRVGVAQALLHDPDVLFLDEATNGFDPNQVLGIRSLIQKLSKTKSVLFSSHLLSEVEELCDKVTLIHNGELVMTDSMQALKSNMVHPLELEIEFEHEVNIQLIKEIQGVKSVVNSEGFNIRVQIDSEDVRGGIMNLIVRSDWKLSSMKKMESKLEDLFRNLTK